MLAADGHDFDDNQDEEMSGAVTVYLLFAENIANPSVSMLYGALSPAHFVVLTLINEREIGLDLVKAVFSSKNVDNEIGEQPPKPLSGDLKGG